MNILTISNLYPHPRKPVHGLYNAQLFEAFARLGHEVTNWCLRPECNLLKWPAIRSWQSPYGGRVRTVYKPVWYLPVLGRSLAWRTYGWSLARDAGEAAEADLVYGAWLYPDGVVAGRLARKRSVPYGIMVQGTDTQHLGVGSRRRAIVDAAQRAAAVICVSAKLRDALLAAGAAPDNVSVVPNGVDTERFRFRPKRQARERLGLPADGRIVLYVGHLWPEKTVDLLLQAFTYTLPHPHTPRLYVAGDGPERAKLERLSRRLGLQDVATFLGSVPYESIPVWINAADCLALSSRSEGMPNVVLEALVSGLPVVTTDVGCCSEILNGEPTSRVVPGRKPDDFAAALAEVLSRPCDRGALAARHRGRYSWTEQATTILQLVGAGPGKPKS